MLSLRDRLGRAGSLHSQREWTIPRVEPSMGAIVGGMETDHIARLALPLRRSRIADVLLL
jgi:hypothetical protein